MLKVTGTPGAGTEPAPAGVTVTFSIASGDATFFGPSTCLTDINGMCSIQITSPNAGNNVIHATTTFTVSGVSLTRSTQSLSSSLCTAFLQPVTGCDAQKLFIPRTPLLLTTVLLGDTVSISGFNLAGTADFTLFGPNDATCSGTPLHTLITTAGVYSWQVTFHTGNTSNTDATTTCTSEVVTISYSPGQNPPVAP
jgi:hypothetical protein